MEFKKGEPQKQLTGLEFFEQKNKEFRQKMIKKYSTPSKTFLKKWREDCLRVIRKPKNYAKK